MPKTDLEVAKEAALAASEVIKKYSLGKNNLNVRHKGLHDIVTEADVASEQCIIDVIKAHFPNDQILAEESASDNGLTDQRTWIIDPIDGTTNFAHGFPVFCVSIALYEKKEPKIGVVLEVNSDELFWAEKGQGAWLNGNQLRVSKAQTANESLLATGFPYRDLGLIDDYLQLFKAFMKETMSVRRPGSASWDLCCVAAGRFDGFYEYGLAPWDVAAGTLIISEAGGVVSDWEGGDDWLFGKRIVTGNADIHGYMLERIKEHISEEFLGN